MSPGRRIRVVLFSLLASFFLAGQAGAHAVLLESTPALHSSVTGSDIPVKLRFNVRIDAARSRLTLIGPDGSSRTLDVSKQGSPDTLSSELQSLPPGEYRLRWQVLASDGHITRGEIPFTVARA